MTLVLSERRALYTINGQTVATLDVAERMLPTPTPFIGIYGFTSDYTMRNFNVYSLQPRIWTLHPRWEPSQASTREPELVGVSCTNISGEEVAKLDDWGASVPSAQDLVESG